MSWETKPADALVWAVGRGLLSEGLRLRLRLRGGSMTPFIRDGDEVEIAACPPDPPRPGQVLLYRSGDGTGAPVVHRLVRVLARRSGGRLVFKGDANPWLDPPVMLSQVQGRVVARWRGGRRRDLTRGLGKGELYLSGALFSALPPLALGTAWLRKAWRLRPWR